MITLVVILNVVAAMAVIVAFAMNGPLSLRAEYRAEVARRVTPSAATALVTGSDLERVPPVVRRYLQRTGIVGRPRPRNMRVRMHGRIRGAATDAWMPFTAEQHTTFDPPARLFYMAARRAGVPVAVFHRFADGEATMRVKAAGMFTIVNASGDELTTAETVTMFNDMALMAPGMLVDPSVRWEASDEHSAMAAFTHAGRTVRATLLFNDDGDLTDFWSDDRRQASADGRTFRTMRWSTPMERHRTFDGIRIATHGEARWHENGSSYAYIEMDIDDIRSDVRV